MVFVFGQLQRANMRSFLDVVFVVFKWRCLLTMELLSLRFFFWKGVGHFVCNGSTLVRKRIATTFALLIQQNRGFTICVCHLCASCLIPVLHCVRLAVTLHAPRASKGIENESNTKKKT